jgi:hypothetical protein
MVIALIMFGLANIFIGPHQEVAATPVKVVFADDFPERPSTPLPAWNVVAVRQAFVSSEPLTNW